MQHSYPEKLQSYYLGYFGLSRQPQHTYLIYKTFFILDLFQKNLIKTIFKNSKKGLFWAIFGPFYPKVDIREFSLKIEPHQFLVLIKSNNHVKNRKKLIGQTDKRPEGQTKRVDFIGPSCFTWVQKYSMRWSIINTSLTVAKTGCPRCIVPAFFGDTPPTTFVPYAIACSQWKVPYKKQEK